MKRKFLASVLLLSSVLLVWGQIEEYSDLAVEEFTHNEINVLEKPLDVARIFHQLKPNQYRLFEKYNDGIYLYDCVGLHINYAGEPTMQYPDVVDATGFVDGKHIFTVSFNSAYDTVGFVPLEKGSYEITGILVCAEDLSFITQKLKDPHLNYVFATTEPNVWVRDDAGNKWPKYPVMRPLISEYFGIDTINQTNFLESKIKLLQRFNNDEYAMVKKVIYKLNNGNGWDYYLKVPVEQMGFLGLSLLGRAKDWTVMEGMVGSHVYRYHIETIQQENSPNANFYFVEKFNEIRDWMMADSLICLSHEYYMDKYEKMLKNDNFPLDKKTYDIELKDHNGFIHHFDDSTLLVCKKVLLKDNQNVYAVLSTNNDAIIMNDIVCSKAGGISHWDFQEINDTITCLGIQGKILVHKKDWKRIIEKIYEYKHIFDVEEQERISLMKKQEQAMEQRQREHTKQLEVAKIARFNHLKELYGENIAHQLMNHKITLGMTKEMCEWSWGKPSHVTITKDVYGTREIWSYGFYKELEFLNGKLVSISK